MKRELIITLMLSLTLISTSPINASAASKSSLIPAHMKPGTVIQYDKNNKMIIISDGYDTQKNHQKINNNHNSISSSIIKEKIQKNINNIAPTNEKVFLPIHQPRMRVSYDGTGTPTIIKDANGNPVVDNNKNSFSPMDCHGYNSPDRYFTWYTDTIEQGDHVLQDTDCATKMYVDDPPLVNEVGVLIWK